ncbi:unnamed protein product [Haemonchus placei]|uniref:POU domain protein n=1 Tax=Haemonchus placei TaxID=6290 RepID=A0A0N4WQU1_HAEPC|nr:unnamed protein product [Haemonchus placei]
MCFCADARCSTKFIDELKQFVTMFKKRRIELGLTQRDVGKAIPATSKFSQTTISRFESRALSLKNMCKMRAFLSYWLSTVDETVKETSAPQSAELHSRKPRRSRTRFQKSAQAKMEQHFAKERWPNPPTLAQLADELKLDFEVVRVWFCNRRQKFKREREMATAPLPEIAFVTSNPALEEHGFSRTLSYSDPYPLEELCATSEFVPFQ